MDNIIIQEATEADLKKCVQVIRKRFETVVKEFGLTPQNCPKHAVLEEKWLLKEQKTGTVFLYYVKSMR